MKRFTVLFLMGTLLGLLAACAPATTTEPAAATVPPPAVQVETQPTLPPATDLPAATELPAVTALPEATQPPAATAVPAATEPAEPTALPEPTVEPAPAIVYGVTDEGAYFYGNPDAPVTLIDYSDFLWPTCRAFVQGTEPQLSADYVETGDVKLVFWPVLNHGNPSVFATVTAECAGQQDPALFWATHEALFANLNDLYRADRDYFVNLAVGVGVDQAAFEACYDDGTGLAKVMAMDDIRRQRGVFSQPTFDINGRVLAGLASYDVFQQLLDQALEAAP